MKQLVEFTFQLFFSTKSERRLEISMLFGHDGLLNKRKEIKFVEQ
jgi:hypothetical protein